MKNKSLISGTVCFFGLAVFLIVSCSKNDYHFNNDDISVIDDLPEEHILSLPTPEKSGQAVHPDIQYIKEGFKGFKFFLVYTPYPFSRNVYENPCFVVSNNGVDFDEFSFGQNPLARTPKKGYNDDPDLFFDNEKKQFNLYYLETVKPDFQNLICLKSNDCDIWKRTLVKHFDLRQDIFILSPAIIKIESVYYMFFVNLSIVHNPIQFIKSFDGENWNFEDRTTITADYPEKFIPWHVDIIPAGNKYIMLTVGPLPDSKLYLAVSSDLENWTFNSKVLLSNTADFYESKSIYRSTGLVFDDKLVIWFSMNSLANEWKIGIKKYLLKNVLPPGVSIY